MTDWLGFDQNLDVSTKNKILVIVIENSEFVIRRFRKASGTSEFYEGDSLQNSIGDIVSAMFGWYLTAILHQAGYPWLVVIWTVISELASVFHMRDCGVLVIIQLLCNSETIKAWQAEKIMEVKNKNQEEWPMKSWNKIIKVNNVEKSSCVLNS